MGGNWFYDMPASIARALADGWGLAPEELAALGAILEREPTPQDIAERAVLMDFERLRAWVCDGWHWVGVSVVEVDADGNVPDDDYTNAVWGIESDGDYWKEAARELV
jgi:hypothetical protein